MNNPPRKGGLKKINADEAKVSPSGGDLEGAICLVPSFNLMTLGRECRYGLNCGLTNLYQTAVYLSSGSVNQKVLPIPGSLSAQILPLCRKTISCDK